MVTTPTFHIAMFPWFAMGHITQYLHFSNKFAERGHRITFFIPTKTQHKFSQLNHKSDLIKFISIDIPPVDGLAVGVETMSDVPLHKGSLFAQAFDPTQDQVKVVLQHLKPNFIFFDLAYWVPTLACPLGIKPMYFPTGCRELEGHFCEYIGNQYKKRVLLLGPVLRKPSHIPLAEKWGKWLAGFEKGSVVYCAFGSECVLTKDQFQELVLGLELTGFPFIVRLKPPFGVDTVEEALPDGFKDRIGGRGVVHGDWVQQELILNHPSVGCFVSHCGFGSMWESLVNTCQIIVVPHAGDQFVNAKFMTRELKVAVDVERREEDGWFTKESMCKAVKLVMDQGSEVGEQVRANHHKWKDFLLSEGLESSYLDNFFIKLQDTLN
ncbi:hypothetical protein IFM89_022426 [Coptis chinensis]|uniref:Glycosyltransferase n=1 Tax=Coptis chinensis TaxID=261450 RepID=A0A835LZ80_9MAGN|nr:hypothetical protein IFM89_022426 [Coptis chinensis]